MKNYVIVFIVLVFCYIGYLVKEKYKNQKIMLEEIKNFLDYYKNNMFVFKDNVIEIIQSYKIIQNNKNALSSNLFQNTGNLLKFNEKLTQRYIFDDKIALYLKNYFDDFGTKTQEIEKEKTDNFLVLLNDLINKTSYEIKMKGDIWFKIFIAIGLVFAIILW